MKLLHPARPFLRPELQNHEKPELYRQIYPYTKISRIEFDGYYLPPRPADPMFITDTTFRDGQQARPPYTAKQIVDIFTMLHRLGGKSGLIRASEFFMYSDKDRKAIELCRELNYRYPRITGWIRANVEDLKIAKSMEFEEVGLSTSVSDYHIYLKLGLDREKALASYLAVVEQALEWGISPRCHFEDITRADIYGFCLPFALRLMELSKQSGLPVKIRLCDTMGYGVPFPGASMPRSVARLVRTFTDEAGVPGQWLEWHGHNDFHKTLANGVTAWINGCSGINGTLLGFGERTGNTPIEALVIDYISLTGDDDAADTRVISEIAQYFESELKYRIPDNYPFVGKDFNATSAGIHADGLIKNEEIYNIFDTTLLLNRSVPITITDKSGRAGVAYWINQSLKLPEGQRVTKAHPGVGQIYSRITHAYECGRTTSFSNTEIMNLVRRYMPELLVSEFDQMKQMARDLASRLIIKLAHACDIHASGVSNKENLPRMEKFAHEHDFIQYLYLTDNHGALLLAVVGDPAYKHNYEKYPIGYDFSEREWFKQPMKNGGLHITDIYQSFFTGKLVITVSIPVTDKDDNITGIMGADIQLEALLKRAEELAEEASFSGCD